MNHPNLSSFSLQQLPIHVALSRNILPIFLYIAFNLIAYGILPTRSSAEPFLSSLFTYSDISPSLAMILRGKRNKNISPRIQSIRPLGRGRRRRQFCYQTALPIVYLSRRYHENTIQYRFGMQAQRNLPILFPADPYSYVQPPLSTSKLAVI